MDMKMCDMHQWIRLSKQRPPINCDVLLLTDGKIGFGCITLILNGEVRWLNKTDFKGNYNKAPSHWMHLPEVPQSRLAQIKEEWRDGESTYNTIKNLLDHLIEKKI